MADKRPATTETTTHLLVLLAGVQHHENEVARLGDGDHLPTAAACRATRDKGSSGASVGVPQRRWCATASNRQQITTHGRARRPR